MPKQGTQEMGGSIAGSGRSPERENGNLFFFFFLYVIHRSFIGSKLEQTIRIVYRQYSVHTIKVKGIQNLYKTKHTGGKKTVQLKRDSGKILSIL